MTYPGEYLCGTCGRYHSDNRCVLPGRKWTPQQGYLASMSRHVLMIHDGGVSYSEGWPSDIKDAFTQWWKWWDWVEATHAKSEATS